MDRPGLELMPGDIAQTLVHMTFPSYGRLLSLQQTMRHPEWGDARLIQPHAVAAKIGDEIVGLALLETPVQQIEHAELLSVFVVDDARNQGIGTELVRAAERGARSVKLPSIRAVYTSGRPGTAALERVLQKCGWSPPSVRAVTVRFTPHEAMKTPWFARVRWNESDFDIFLWADLTAEERAQIEQSHAAEPWIRKGLEPWRHDHYGFDPVSSVGLRYRGTVVGWVINHQVAADHVRFTCSFMREDLSKRGRILPLYTESIRRLAASGCRLCTLVTPVHYSEMAEFLRRRCASCVTYFGESRGAFKELTPEPVAAPAS
jgi:GNAT superfamily N-acetyltransferase